MERESGDGAENTSGGASGGASTTAAPPSDPSLKAAKKEKWIPNENYLQALLSLGMPKRDCIKALYITKNKSADLAAGWLFENDAEAADIPAHIFDYDKETAEDSSSSDEDLEAAEPGYKMVFVVNTDLKMRLGKASAQVGHATLGLYRFLMADDAKYGEMLRQWDTEGEMKICLAGQNFQQLLDLEAKAREADLPCYLVEDAGRTQIPAGSLTVLSVFGKIEDVNKITGSLKLL